jgi:hypothetical protein
LKKRKLQLTKIWDPRCRRLAADTCEDEKGIPG